MFFLHGALMPRCAILIFLLCQAMLMAQAPTWSTALPQTPYRLYAVGVVSLQQNEAGARKKASLAARLELILTLRTKARGSVTAQSRTVRLWDEGRETTQSSIGTFGTRMDLQAFAEALPGLEVQEVWVDRVQGQVFALAALDLVRARAAHAEDGRALQAQVIASLSEATGNGWKERLSRFMEAQVLADRLTTWTDTRALLAAAGIPPEPLGPNPAQVRELRERAQLSLALVETLDLPVDLVTGLHAWRSMRSLGIPAPSPLRLTTRATSDWSQLMDLERVRAQWTLVLISPEGDLLSVWTFEEQAVGATRAEALQRLTGKLLPRVHESLDRWFGFPSPSQSPSLTEAS